MWPCVLVQASRYAQYKARATCKQLTAKKQIKTTGSLDMWIRLIRRGSTNVTANNIKHFGAHVMLSCFNDSCSRADMTLEDETGCETPNV